MNDIMNVKKNKAIDIVVKGLNWEREYSIDTEIFGNELSDLMVEAATRSLDLNNDDFNIYTDKIAGVLYCHLKSDNNEYILNSYKILLNAARYKIAEVLRENFKSQFQKDLKDEPFISGLKNKKNGK